MQGKSEGAGAAASPLVRAVEYIRRSTGDQEHSLALQSAGNHAYAANRSMEIVRTYADDGKSGLTLRGRSEFKKLIAEVQTGRADFKVILVYDVSRWGRFQDTDEGAYLEYICRSAGIRVHYCAELFENDGSLFAAIMKNIKRAMAGEYSRDLSVKVFAGQSNLIRLGFNQGAAPGFGLRRLLVDQNRTPKLVLKRGEYKSISTDRIILIPGPPEEVEIVRWIYDSVVREGKREREIAVILNRRKIPNGTGRIWTTRCVNRLLTNEKYIGNSVWNRESIKLKKQRVRNDPAEWIRFDGAFEAVVDRATFAKAQAILRVPLPPLTQEQKLEPLRRLYRKHGYLTAKLINKSNGVPAAGTYGYWFGSLFEAYRLVGFTAPWEEPRRQGPRRTSQGATRMLSDEELLAKLRGLLKERGYLTQRVIDESADIPCASTYQKRFGRVARAYELIGYKDRSRREHRWSHKATRGLSNRQLLDGLRRLLRTRGYLNQRIIEEATDFPCAATYQYRFGTLSRAYELIGYRVGKRPFRQYRMSDEQLLLKLRRLRERHGYLSGSLIEAADSVPGKSTYVRRFGNISKAYRLIGYDPEAHQARAQTRRRAAATKARA